MYMSSLPKRSSCMYISVGCKSKTIITNERINVMIRELEESDIKGLNNLPPIDWKFDYESFVKSFIEDDFFYAFVITQNSKYIQELTIPKIKYITED